MGTAMYRFRLWLSGAALAAPVLQYPVRQLDRDDFAWNHPKNNDSDPDSMAWGF
jgi:hypothetical protein